jgi:hypothetical protein
MEVKKPRARWTFEYTTERVDGKFWAIKRRWTKGVGRITHKVGFKHRNKAKARVLAWYARARQ